jgi:hypothetical protein
MISFFALIVPYGNFVSLVLIEHTPRRCYSYLKIGD